MLFGDEFDFDERAEVGGGLGCVEGVDAFLTAIGFLGWLRAVEDEITQGHPVVNGYSDHGDFVDVGHGLIMM